MLVIIKASDVHTPTTFRLAPPAILKDHILKLSGDDYPGIRD